MAKVEQAEAQQEGLSPDQEVKVWETALRQALEYGISLSNGNEDEVELNTLLKQILQALNGGNFGFLEQCRPGGPTAAPRGYDRTIELYLGRLKVREDALCKPGMNPEQVLQGLLGEREIEMVVSGFYPDKDNFLCGRQENEARGAMKALHDAIRAVKRSKYPIAEIRRLQKEAKAREEQLRSIFVESSSKIMGGRQETTIAANMCGREISGQKVLEEALRILSGGEVTQVQAAIFRVITKLLFFATGEQNVFLMREGELGTYEEIIAELGHRIKCGPFSVPKIEGREVREGNRMEVLEWARNRFAQLRAEIAGKKELCEKMKTGIMGR